MGLQKSEATLVPSMLGLKRCFAWGILRASGGLGVPMCDNCVPQPWQRWKGVFMWSGLCRVWVIGAVVGLWAPQVWATCHPGAALVPWQQVASGVWVWAPAQVAEIAPANAGFVAPVSAIVDRDEALVIDPGPSFFHGQRVRESVACQLGARVVAVVNTHAHAENVLGNAAFADVRYIYASDATAKAMAERCPQCLDSLTERVGESAMAGTHIVLPNHRLQPGHWLHIGRRKLQVWSVEQGHTEGDLVLWMPANRTLWVGGLAYKNRVPELAQGRLENWLQALDRLMALHARTVVSTVVSSSGTVGGAEAAMLDTQAYLLALREKVWTSMETGGTPHDTGALGLSWAEHWVGYPNRHGFNAQRAWRELEPGWMAR